MTPFACALLLLVACQPRQMVVPIDPSAPPEIGITATFPGQNSAVFEALEAAGAAPVFLHPPVEASAMSALADLDGLVLGGGADLDPALYGETAHASTNLEDGTRQAMDLALSRAAFEADVPLLGICLGAQVMVVQRGGSLVQDIPSELPMALDHHAPHSVAVEPGSPLARLYPGPTLEVRSLHHQAADVLPAGFELAATAPDGVIEAFWDPSQDWAVGLQYHPERDATDQDLHGALWADFVDHAQQRRRNRLGARQSE